MGSEAQVYVGTSGWYYDHWEGVLYPPGLSKAKRLGVYAERYNAVEINATYYRLPSASMVEGWHGKAPPGFVYVAKASREITHKRKLRNAAEPLTRFLDVVSGLEEKLANVLFQLPPSLHKNLALLEDFLVLLPPGGRFSFEFRHPSWECDETFDVLKRAGATHVVVGRKGYPFAEVHTAPVAYYRLHGPEALCASSYSDEWLGELARTLAALARGGTTSFAFFNNDVGGHAVRNADTLNRHLAQLGILPRPQGKSAREGADHE